MKLFCRLLSATSLSILLAAPAVAQPDFKLSSPDIAPGGKIDNKFVLNAFGCTGENVSPALVWKNAPAGTRSFALSDKVLGKASFTAYYGR
ncbi:hypothetical protein [Paraburkholderia lacunae]|uniref:YbhB/YbcL family Raf kinase inhibitor-like protein n=1 Tax=Paraburkholderia lacunae TaxID=2211104 RepID=A0A370N343_9BURK|nr:hypothetical protein [Paraburkholderia lacunae]RDK00044.1 hypothetical protein DLM46_25410 [Paraburkholderia lacunae]